ncbi:MAG TPA: endonuclease/exonuclease/phosphatase family protein [Chloroflexia bacterium]|nr:endonuclease/exonuclease/phosphatase family protein [Chloroflexia bacterium]
MRVSLPYDGPIGASVPLRRGILPSLGALVLLAYPLLVLLLTCLSFLFHPRTGLLAVTRLFAPHLFLPLLLLVPFAFRRGSAGVTALRVALLLCLCLFCVSYLPRLSAASPNPDPSAPKLSVLTWNVFSGNRSTDAIRDALLAGSADVVVLQEADWRWVDIDDVALIAAYPYRLAQVDDAPPGMALLSKYPIVGSGVLDGHRDLWDIPRLLWARIDLGGGILATVIDAHPISPYYSGGDCPLPACFDPALRDRQLTAIRDDYLQPLIDSGEPFVLAGDLNLNEREPAYADFTRGLIDTFKAVGTGFGTSWRPQFIMNQPIGVLRIDYLMAAPNVKPLSVTTDCTPRHSDHCVLRGTFELESAELP